jgi:hypothetical protein
MTSYSSCSVRRGSALAAAAAFVALSLAQPRSAQAITLRPSSEVLVPPAASVCYRSPDIVAADNFYFVAYVAGPCAGSGAHTVRIARYDGLSVASAIHVDVASISASDVRVAPLVRISAVGGQVVVLIANRSGSVNQLSTAAFDRNLGRQMMMGPQNAQGLVAQLSFDCSAAAFPPCVASTLEIVAGSPRVYSYFAITNAGVAPMLGMRVDQPIAVAAVAGTAGQSATIFATNSMLDAAPHVMASFAPMGGIAPLGMGGEPVAPGVAAVRLLDTRVAAFWSQPGTVRFAVRSQWSAIAGALGAALSIVGDPYFLIEDAAVVGTSTLLVGRTSLTTAGLDAAAIGHGSTTLGSASPSITVRNTGVVPRSSTRVAASTGQCATAGNGALVYALGPTGAANEIHVRRFACSDPSECVDPAGRPGRCEMGACAFAPGSVCVVPPDAGAPDASAPDASAPDASAMDVAPTDGSLADSGALDAAVDGGADASVPRDGGDPPVITGGACGCRAPGSTQGRAAATWLALVAALALASRRRR